MNITEDILIEIIRHLDDKSFIIYIHTKKEYNTLSHCKPLTNQYKMSKITKNLKTKYTFTNILYNFRTWKESLVPLTITDLNFGVRFDHLSIRNVNNFKNLKRLGIGNIFVNIKFINNLISSSLEKKSIEHIKLCSIANFLTNNFLVHETRSIFENQISYEAFSKIEGASNFFLRQIEYLDNKSDDQKIMDYALNFTYNFNDVQVYKLKELLILFGIDINNYEKKEIMSIILSINRQCHHNVKVIKSYFLRLHKKFKKIEEYNLFVNHYLQHAYKRD